MPNRIWRVRSTTAGINKYTPHDTGKRGRAATRRLRQIKMGTLKGDYISEDARYTASGLHRV